MIRDSDARGARLGDKFGRWLCRRGWHAWVIEHVEIPGTVDGPFVRSALGIQEKCERPGCCWHRDALSGVAYELDPA